MVDNTILTELPAVTLLWESLPENRPAEYQRGPGSRQEPARVDYTGFITHDKTLAEVFFELRRFTCDSGACQMKGEVKGNTYQ